MTNTARRWLLAATFTAAGIAGAAAYDAATQAARADDRPAATAEQPGSLLGAVAALPAQAAEVAHEVVDDVLPEPAAAEPEPAAEPDQPQPAAEDPPKPAPDADEKPAEPAEQPDEAQPEPEAADEPATEPRTSDPAGEPDQAEQPADSPEPDTTPLCDLNLANGICDILDDVLPTPIPNPAGPIVVPAPVGDVLNQATDVILRTTKPAPTPAVVDAAPAAALPLQQPAAAPPDPAPAAAATTTATAAAAAADCWQPPGRDRADQRTYDGLNPRPHHRARNGGCPDTPRAPTPHVDCTPATTGNGSNTTTWLLADLTDTQPTPILGLLYRARARSTIPTSRHAAVEPGPA